MSLDQENRCDGCQEPIHPNAGARCVACALDFGLPTITAADPFVMPGKVETFDDIFDCLAKETSLNRARRLRREAAHRGGTA